MTIDVDSMILEVSAETSLCRHRHNEVYGNQKEGASYGYTHIRGYRPVLATRADTGEVLHLRFRKGSSNAQRFVRELVGRC
jgi:hypothetical protein